MLFIADFEILTNLKSKRDVVEISGDTNEITRVLSYSLSLYLTHFAFHLI